jgi:amino acid permease
MVASIGEKAGVFTDVTLFFHTLFSCVGYITLIGDFTTKSMAGLFPGCIFAESRLVSILSITILVLFPLSLLRDLSSLKFTSAVGLFVTALACLYVFCECVATAGENHAIENLTENAWFVEFGWFKCLALFNGSFSAHYNAPTYYAELQEQTFANYAKATLYSFAIATALFTGFGLCGYARFGNDVQGNILKGYSGDSTLVQLCWLCMMMSTVFVFPLAFQRMRSSWQDLVSKVFGLFHFAESGCAASGSSIAFTTVGLLAVCVYFGTAFEDIAVIKMIKGATLGVSIMFIMPGMAYLALCNNASARSVSMVPRQSIRLFCGILIVVGVFQGTLALLSHYKIV